MARKPWFKFWPEYELALRCVSPSACRVGISMLSLCNQSSRRGFALLSGRPASALQIARLAVADCTPDEAALWCRELCESAMASFNESDGSFSIPRMVQDESEDGRDRENGKKGGNPRLANPLPTHCQPPSNPSLSSSCSSSLPSGSEGGRGETAPPAPIGQMRPDPNRGRKPAGWDSWPPGLRRTWDAYPGHRRGSARDWAKLWASMDLEPIADQIVRSVEGWKLSDQWRENVIPLGETFIRQERYTGDLPPDAAKAIRVADAKALRTRLFNVARLGGVTDERAGPMADDAIRRRLFTAEDLAGTDGALLELWKERTKGAS